MKGRRNHRDFIALLVKIISNLGTDNTEPSLINGEGVTTIPKGSTAKWQEARDI
jgi:hypothetical protein